MLYANRFAGHLDMDDPRTPVTAAGGCVWPTVPAHRYLLQSDNATGSLASLLSAGLLVEKVTSGPAHNFCSWSLVFPHPSILECAWQKTRVASPLGYTWYFSLRILPGSVWQTILSFELRKCNVDVPIGVVTSPDSSDHTGTDFKALQVEWDQWTPPA